MNEIEFLQEELGDERHKVEQLRTALMTLMRMHLTPERKQDWHARDCGWQKPDGEFCAPSCRLARAALKETE